MMVIFLFMLLAFLVLNMARDVRADTCEMTEYRIVSKSCRLLWSTDQDCFREFEKIVLGHLQSGAHLYGTLQVTRVYNDLFLTREIVRYNKTCTM